MNEPTIPEGWIRLSVETPPKMGDQMWSGTRWRTLSTGAVHAGVKVLEGEHVIRKIDPLTLLQEKLYSLYKQSVYGCGNHGCVIAPPKGQGTNGLCRCTPRHFCTELNRLAYEVIQKQTWTEENQR